MDAVLWLTCFGLLVMIVAVIVLWRGFSDMVVDIIDLIDKTARLEIIIQRMDSKLDTLLQKRSSPLLKGDRDKSEDTY